MNLGKWAAVQKHFTPSPGKKGIVKVSGGRTSAMMAALSPPETLLCFQNTGLEHEGTYEFLRELEAGLGRQILWLEYQKPERKGAPPREARTRVVSFKTASRNGEPLEQFLEAIAEYRATKGEPPISPWPRSRICTAHLKIKTAVRWQRENGLAGAEELVGLRADEPERVGRLKYPARAPLSEAGITKNDVLLFWKMQDFDLRIEESQGNCTGCFLKDQSDLARVMNQNGTHFDVWHRLENKYPDFGGTGFRGYAFLKAEGPLRLRIEASLKAGQEPINDGSMDARRFKYVVIQERKRLQGLVPSFSCSCEGAETLAAADED